MTNENGLIEFDDAETVAIVKIFYDRSDTPHTLAVAYPKWTSRDLTDDDIKRIVNDHPELRDLFWPTTNDESAAAPSR